MIRHSEISDQLLRKKIAQGQILFAGNERLKIYGTLQCRSGKKMKRRNTVFFASELEAQKMNYRPCGHCLKNNYDQWKIGVKK